MKNKCSCDSAAEFSQCSGQVFALLQCLTWLNLRVFHHVVDQGHYGGALCWSVLVISATRPILSNNKLGDRAHTEPHSMSSRH